MPTNTYIKSDGSVAFQGNQSMGGFRLTNVADATQPGDAVNLQTLQSAINNINSIGRSYTAGENIANLKAVYVNTNGHVYLASSSDINHMGKVIGITNSAQLAGSDIEVVSIGMLGGFSGLTTGAEYFLGENGSLSNIAPSTGFTQILGVAISPTQLLIDIKSAFGI